MASLNSVSQWDEIVDVLICGYGCAGASAAIEARDTAPDARGLLVGKNLPAGTAACRASRC